MKTEMAQLQQSAVHNHTAAMLEMGTNLLSQTAEQTRKLTDVETQVTLKKCFRMFSNAYIFEWIVIITLCRYILCFTNYFTHFFLKRKSKLAKDNNDGVWMPIDYFEYFEYWKLSKVDLWVKGDEK